MEFYNAVNARYSCRKFSDKPLDRSAIKRAVYAARQSPSACNSQPAYYIIIDDAEMLEMIRPHLTFNKFAQKAPVLCAVVNEGGNILARLGDVAKGKDFSSIDTGISIQTFCLACANEGIDTCILGIFNEKAIKSNLNIPKNKRLNIIIAMGIREEEPKKRSSRKELDEILSFNTYNSVEEPIKKEEKTE